MLNHVKPLLNSCYCWLNLSKVTRSMCCGIPKPHAAPHAASPQRVHARGGKRSGMLLLSVQKLGHLHKRPSHSPQSSLLISDLTTRCRHFNIVKHNSRRLKQKGFSHQKLWSKHYRNRTMGFELHKLLFSFIFYYGYGMLWHLIRWTIMICLRVLHCVTL